MDTQIDLTNIAKIGKKRSVDNAGNKRIQDREAKDRRRLSLYQKNGLFCENDTGTTITRAVSSFDLKQSFHLVHDIFEEIGYIHKYRSGMRIRPYEVSPDTATFVAKLENDIIGAISLIEDSIDLGLPSERTFPLEIDQLRSRGYVVCEVSNQAIVKEYRMSAVSTELMRCILAQALRTGCSKIICSISPNQKNFYEFIDFQQVCETRSYSEKIYDPVMLMCCHVDDLYKHWCQLEENDSTMDSFWKKFWVENSPYISSIESWAVQAEQAFVHSLDMVDFLGECEDFFVKANSNQLTGLRLRLGKIFNRASGSKPASPHFLTRYSSFSANNIGYHGHRIHSQGTQNNQTRKSQIPLLHRGQKLRRMLSQETGLNSNLSIFPSKEAEATTNINDLETDRMVS